MKTDETLYAVGASAGIELILRADQVVPYLLAAQQSNCLQARVVALETTDTYAFLPLRASRHVIADVLGGTVRFAQSDEGRRFLLLFLQAGGDGARVLFGGTERVPEASPAPPERVERPGSSWNWHVPTPTPGPLGDARDLPSYRTADFRKLVDGADGEAIVNSLRFALASLREVAITTSDTDQRYRVEGDLNRLVVLLRQK